MAPLEIKTMSELDQSMSNVLNNQELSTMEKLNMYSQILSKNLKLEEKLKESPVNPEHEPENINKEDLKQESIDEEITRELKGTEKAAVENSKGRTLDK